MSKNFIVVSDVHFPYHDPKAINAVKRFIKATPIDVVVFNGDILDMYDVSSFDKSPDRINSLQEELNMAMKLFGDIRKELPEAEMVYVEGNHEYRLKRYLMRHPELFSLEALQLPNLLKLDKFNIKYTDKPYYLGNLKITHGSIVRKFAGYTAKAEMEKNDCSGISGHCFSEDVEVLTPDGWKKVIDVNIGDTVATISKEDQSFEFNEVRDKFVYDDYKELYHIKSTVVDVMVTDKHGLLGFNKDTNRLEEFDAKYLATTGKRYKFMCGALKNNTAGIDLSEELIRLLVNISADGSIEGSGIRFHLKKQRKITHLKALLSSLEYKYTETKTNKFLCFKYLL